MFQLIAELVLAILCWVVAVVIVVPVLLLFGTPVILVLAAFRRSPYWRTVVSLFRALVKEGMLWCFLLAPP
jgi:hypothetical protein